MAQYLKDDVQAGIARAALEVFAEKGFAKAGIAEIAARAGISTGNVYRYFENKTVLYESVVPDDFVSTLQRLLRQRLDAAKTARDLRKLPPGAPYRVISDELLPFCIEHRLQVVVLLSGCEGTTHEGFPEKLARSLVGAALAHFEVELSRPQRFALEELYRNFVRSLERIFRQYAGEREIREAIDAFSRYHLSGLVAFFDIEGGSK